MDRPPPPRILLAEHGRGAAAGLAEGLAALGLAVEVTRNAADTWVALRRQMPDAVLLAPLRHDGETAEFSSLASRAALVGGPALLVLTDHPERLQPRWHAIDDFLPRAASAAQIERRLRFVLARRRARRRDLDEQERLRRDASTDFKTGLLNDRAFSERCRLEASRARRQSLPVAVLVIDFDRFKELNDAHGHDAGDRALEAFGRVLRASLRDFDSAARIGGDEFAVLLPGTRLPIAAGIGERVRANVAALELEPGGVLMAFTISVGVSDWDPERGGSLEDVVREADVALLAAKGAGGNRVLARTALEASEATGAAPPGSPGPADGAEPRRRATRRA